MTAEQQGSDESGGGLGAVDVAAHRDSYPMGNIHHGTPERPDWGTFCVECEQSWPCDVSTLGAALATARREVEEMRAEQDEANEHAIECERIGVNAIEDRIMVEAERDDLRDLTDPSQGGSNE